jgi:antitoxin component of MazEF toxin-antitoxin module
MEQKVFRSGNSLTVVISADFVRKIGVKAGDKVIVEQNLKKGRLIINFPAPRQLRLEN